MNLPPALEKIRPRNILLISAGFIAIIIVTTGAIFIYNSIQKTSSTPKAPSPNESPEIEQKGYLLSSKNPNEEHKKTLYGKIVKIEGDTLILENKGRVKIEIAEGARFYHYNPKKGLEPSAKENFQPDETILVGGLTSSEIAEYKAEIFALSAEPTLLWRTP